MPETTTTRQRGRLDAIGLSICCLSVDLPIGKMQKRDFLKKTNQFIAMVSIVDQ